MENIQSNICILFNYGSHLSFPSFHLVIAIFLSSLDSECEQFQPFDESDGRYYCFETFLISPELIGTYQNLHYKWNKDANLLQQ